jgi:ferrous iron transport protein B
LKEDADKIAFIQELPAIRLPNLKGIIRKTYYRLYWFLKESLMVFVYAALALFVIDRFGILDAAKKILSPVVEGVLGLPLAMVDAIILCFARHEAGAGLVINLVRKGQLDYAQILVAIIITTTFAPCFANIMAMAKEVGRKTTLVMLFAISVSALVAGGALNWTLVSLL